jgi:hypothetical protein
MFLQSKDDNLLLQVGGFILAILNANPHLKSNVVALFDGVADQKAYCKIKTKKDLISTCQEVVSMAPPFRNFTIRLFYEILR